MPKIENPRETAQRRALGARLARSAIVLGFSGWLGISLANWFFDPSKSLFLGGVVASMLCGAGVALRVLQVVYSRRFPMWIKSGATLFMLLVAYGVVVALSLLALQTLPDGFLQPEEQGVVSE